jgi:hypothetical protein
VILMPTLALAVMAPTAVAQQQDTIRRPGVTIVVSHRSPPPPDTVLTRSISPGSPLLVDLDKKSVRARSDTLFVSSTSSPMGTALDTSFEGLFAPFYQFGPPHQQPLLLVTQRFVLDSQHVGFLLRVPGMYEDPTQIDLWVYDIRWKRFAEPIVLAEGWGDAGCGVRQDALLIDLNHDHRPDLLIQVTKGCSDMNTGRVLSQVDSVWTRIWEGGGYSEPRSTSDPLLRHLLDSKRGRP